MFRSNPKIDYFDSKSLREGLKGKTVRGGMAVGASQLGIALIQLASIPILSRLLEPEEFGLIAMSMVFTGFASMFIDAGLSTATLQREEINHRQVSNLFWVSASLGFLAMLVMMLLSPLIARFFGKPELAGITFALSVPFALSGLALQPIALLSRSMQYSKAARIEVLSSLGGAITAIVWAWCYRDYWALVAQLIVAAFLRLSLAGYAAAWWPSLPQRGVGTRDMVRFGTTLFSSSVVNYVARNTDKLLIGYLAGADTLGLYDRAKQLLNLPLQKVNGPLSSIMVPTLSRLNTEPKQYRLAYASATTLILAIAVPFAAVAFVAPEACVSVVFGSGWDAMIPMFQILAVGSIALPVFNSLSWLLISQGRAKTLLAMITGEGASRVVFLAIGAAWGALGIAFVETARLFVALPIIFLIVGNRELYRANELLKILGISCVSFAATSLTIAWLSFAIGREAGAPATLAILVPCALTVSVLVLTAFPTTRNAGRTVVRELANFCRRSIRQQATKHTS